MPALNWFNMLFVARDIEILRTRKHKDGSRDCAVMAKFIYNPAFGMWEMEGSNEDRMYDKADIRYYYQGKTGYSFRTV